jgi:hypothetical protein
MRRLIVALVVVLLFVGTSTPVANAQVISRGKYCEPWQQFYIAQYRACAWINVDYTNHRMRGYVRVETRGGALGAHVRFLSVYKESPGPRTTVARLGYEVEGYTPLTEWTSLYNCPNTYREYFAHTSYYVFIGSTRSPTQYLTSLVIRTRCR